MDSENIPPVPPSSSTPELPPAAPPRPINWGYWARRLLVCNPFFLCSAALLLFGVNRLSLDPTFLGDERASLFFNYSALQFYEWLVVLTAVVLARRKIWYDSALLAVMEHGLLLVPFMLISQGALLKFGTGLQLAGGAVVFAVLRAVTLRRCYPQFNLPPRALVLGAVVLLLNAALPVVFPAAVEKDGADWLTPNLLLWNLALPALVLGANFLPTPKRYGGLNPERHWLPLFIYALWITGTAAHFWCLGHISNLRFDLQLLGPATVAAAWTMYRRIGDCVPEPGLRWRFALLALTFSAPLVALGNPVVFETLVLTNTAIYAVLFFKGSSLNRTVVRELLFCSLPFALIGMSDELGRVLMPYFIRPSAVVLGVSVLICLCALRWFRLRLGLAGAMATTAIVALLWPGAPLHAYAQTAALFFLAHSLAWRSGIPGATAFRSVVGALWLIDAALWIHNAPWRTSIGVTASAFLLLVAWFAIWRVSRQRPDLSVAVTAAAVSLCAPTDWLVRQGSPGLLALAASVFLFAMGCAVAWTRHRWERHGAARE